jgi:hypothetical protein
MKEREGMFNRTVFAIATIAVVGALVSTSVPVLARSHAKSSAAATDDNSACRRDVRRLCRHVKADGGSGAFLGCLQEHRSRLSKACNEALKSHGL